jgi:hypothetical protein
MTTKRQTGFTVFLLVAITSAGWAHAFLDHAEPGVGSKVRAVRQVKIWFTRETGTGAQQDSGIRYFQSRG